MSSTPQTTSAGCGPRSNFRRKQLATRLAPFAFLIVNKCIGLARETAPMRSKKELRGQRSALASAQICVFCGTGFAAPAKARGPLRKLCSEPCRVARKRSQDRQYRAEGRYPPRRTIYRGSCVVCGAPFESINKPTRACRPGCGSVLSGRIRTERARERNKRNCERCGLPFLPSNPSAKQRRAGHRQLFCSVSCANAARHRSTVPLIASIQPE
jgi:hypothetical protein